MVVGTLVLYLCDELAMYRRNWQWMVVESVPRARELNCHLRRSTLVGNQGHVWQHHENLLQVCICSHVDIYACFSRSLDCPVSTTKWIYKQRHGRSGNDIFGAHSLNSGFSLASRLYNLRSFTLKEFPILYVHQWNSREYWSGQASCKITWRKLFG